MKVFLLVVALAIGLAEPAVISRTPESRQGTSKSGTSKPASASELDSLLAPVALYPDQLLAQMLLCAAEPSKVATLSEWLRSQTLSGSELQDQAVASGFDESFAALVLFPDVVEMMASRLDWTRRLGEAFAADRAGVIDSVQRLRKKAKETGALKTTAQQEVETRTTSSGEQVIVIEPANPQVVYVPQYNPQVVYTQPSTVVVHEDNSADAAVAGVVGFAAGIAIGAAIDNNYYYGPYGWHGGAYMYNDAWDDYYDAREDAREDWQDYREDTFEERNERAEDAREQRTERQQTTQQERTNRSQTAQQERTERTQSRQEGRATTQGQASTASTASTTTRPTAESRGYGGTTGASREKSGGSSDAFSGYSSGRSERAASSRGQKSRSSSRSGGRRKR